MKWIVPGVILLLLLLAFFVYQRNSVKTEYVNGLPAYNALPGREYIFEQDCYVFKLKDHDTSWPLVGSHQTVAALPAVVAAKAVGTETPEVRLLDIVRTGDRFKIVSVRRDRGRTATAVTFEILFLDEEKRKYPRLDAYWILDHSPEARGEAPSILRSYAVSAQE